jgi:RNA polymerase-interacting CarD/CdnL/TRCF family regulator
VIPGAGHIQAIKEREVRKRLTQYLVANVSPANGPVASTP